MPLSCPPATAAAHSLSIAVAALLALVLARGVAASQPRVPAAAAGEEASGNGAPSSIAILVDEYCLDCHDSEVKKADLDLEALQLELADRESIESWAKVYRKLLTGEMPPAKRRQPSREEREAVVERLRESLLEAGRAMPDPRPARRRLTRVEYEHTLRDLLALPHLQVRNLLPADGEAHGFDRVDTALPFSHVQVARYLEAAEVALREATAPSPEAPGVVERRLWFHDQYVSGHGVRYGVCIPLSGLEFDATFDASKGVSWDERDAPPACDALGVIRGAVPGSDLYFRPKPPLREPGRYRVRVCVFSFHWNRGEVLPSPEPLPVKWFVGDRPIGYVDAPSLEPTVHELEAYIAPGEEISFDPASIPLRPPVTNETQRDKYSGPGVAVKWIELEGPLHDRWPPESHRRLFGDLPMEPVKGRRRKTDPTHRVTSENPLEDAQRLLRDFAGRAFRGPPPPGEVDRYAALVAQRLESGVGFHDALLTGYKAILCSPDFLFLGLHGDLDPARTADDSGGERKGDTEYDLAARLAAFLWSSIPDAPLRELASSGELDEDGALRKQVNRMLADGRSRRLVVDFLDQWLELEDIDFTMPDPVLYPEFGSWLRDSMLEETRAYITRMLREDIDTFDLVDSDWTMLNAVLADHYGVEDVEGVALRRVKLPDGSPRGGVVTQASVLKVTANGTTTSPVKRGVWVLENILGRPPRPPPPEIAAIDPDTRGTTTIREQLDAHRDSPACASCHVSIDPPGFALESFDVTGGWRERYRALGVGEPVDAVGRTGRPVKYRLGPAVDSAGELGDGREFEDIHGFKRLLRDEREAVIRCVARKLAIYATGRKPDVVEEIEIDAIVEHVIAKGSGLRTLLHEIVQSRLFRGR